MSPELNLRIQLLTEGQRSELQSVLARIETMNALGDLDEGDLHALLDEIEKPLPPPTTIACYELQDSLTDREYARLRNVLQPIAAQCRDRIEFYIAEIPITAISPNLMAKVNAARVEWFKRYEARGRTWSPHD